MASSISESERNLLSGVGAVEGGVGHWEVGEVGVWGEGGVKIRGNGAWGGDFWRFRMGGAEKGKPADPAF